MGKNGSLSSIGRWVKSDLTILVVLLVASSIANVLRGQDNWWDVINYHIYNPWALLNHRWGQDLFPAGIQGYFHPLLDVPYYLLSWVLLPGHPRLVAVISGWPYGFLVFASFLIVRRLINSIGSLGRLERTALIALTVLVSVTGVSAWSQAGTTTNEVTISAIVLFGLTLLLKLRESRTDPRTGSFYALSIGLLLGVAAGFKLTAAIYAPVMGLVVLASSQDVKSAFRFGAFYSVGWLLAFGLIYGPWAWHLFEYTGNPFFPMFNNIFHSSFSAPVGGRDKTSMPKNLMQWFFYPFFWLNLHHPTVYNRLSFRDGRILFFYIIGSVYFLGAGARRLLRKDRVVPETVRVVTLFCALSYVVWLFMFSLLRYGIVIEVLAPVAAIGLLVSAAVRLRMRHAGAFRLVGVAVIVSVLMVSTVYPDVPRIGYSERVYDARTPKLPDDSLVVLANQPMGLLAPLIQSTNRSATFVGLPLCFRKDQWCYRGFYDYGLGHEIREKISGHEGPIFVAYYMNRMPILPQLALFRLSVDERDCRLMTTNATPNVSLCRAHYVPPGQKLVQKQRKLKFGLDIRYLVSGAHVEAHWKVNKCGTETSVAELKFDWQMPKDQKTVGVYLQAPPSNKKVSFAGGRTDGSATTGLWVRAEQSFLFVGQRGSHLARATVRYVPCDGP